MNKLSLYLSIISICFVGQSFAQDGNLQKCKTTEKGGKYKWISVSPLANEPDNLSGYILIKPKDVTKEFLIKLANRLKSELCNTKKFQVVIFDNGKYANPYSMQDYVSSKGKIVLMRGFYSFDRTTGKDVLEFSTKFGNPTTEIHIDLASVKP